MVFPDIFVGHQKPVIKICLKLPVHVNWNLDQINKSIGLATATIGFQLLNGYFIFRFIRLVICGTGENDGVGFL